MKRVDHTRNLLIKIIVLGAIIYMILPSVGRMPGADRLVVALVTSVVTYLLGDLFVLPRWGRTTAAIVDVFLTWGLVLITTAMITVASITWQGGLLIGVIAGVIEWFFHVFLKESPPELGETDRTN